MNWHLFHTCYVVCMNFRKWAEFFRRAEAESLVLPERKGEKRFLFSSLFCPAAEQQRDRLFTRLFSVAVQHWRTLDVFFRLPFSHFFFKLQSQQHTYRRAHAIIFSLTRQQTTDRRHSKVKTTKRQNCATKITIQHQRMMATIFKSWNWVSVHHHIVSLSLPVCLSVWVCVCVYALTAS